MSSSASPDANQNSDEARDRPDLLSPWRLGGLAAVILITVVVLPWTDPSQGSAQGLTAHSALRTQMPAVERRARQIGATADQPLPTDVQWSGDKSILPRLLSQLRASALLEIDHDAQTRFHLSVHSTSEARLIEISGRFRLRTGESLVAFEVERRTGGWVAILPPLLAVVLALFFRRLILALGAAVWLGAALQTGFDPVAATEMFVGAYLWGTVTSTFNLYIIGFTLALVGMVHVIIRMGGIAGILDALTWLASSVRSTRVTCVLLGFVLFFDDYANTVVVGSTMRPVTDDKRISREKLAYLVDSTAAPIAGLAVVSTWIGYEVGLFGELSRQIQLGMSGYEIFFQIIPLRFYCLFTIVFVLMIAISGRDFGPMLTAERRAHRTGQVRHPDSTPLQASGEAETTPKDGIPHRWYNAVIPVALVIGGTIFGMYWSGWRGPAAVPSIPGVDQILLGQESWTDFAHAWGYALGDITGWETWTDALGKAENAKVLFWASIAGSLSAIGLAVGQRLLAPAEAFRAFGQALPMMGTAVAILILAWSIQAVCADVGTSIYLVGTVRHLVAPTVLPLLIFGLAGVVAFSTGTSWGTMGILLPAMIPLAHHMTAQMDYGSVLLLMSFGAVLDGAIFGDHCSPISDTTVMSSIASGVDHLDHVQTQIPYAVTSMTASALFGYAGVAFGIPVWTAYLLGTAGLGISLWSFGTDPRDDDEASATV